MTSPGLTKTLEANIDRLTARRHGEEEEASLSDKLAQRMTAFTGSMTFVALHLVLYGGWIGWNLLGSPKFDPSFVILAMEASVEAIFLSTFVLISQNRQAKAADRRADLDLHISLLTEHELSTLAALVARIAEHVGVEGAESTEMKEVEEDVDAERVLDALERETPEA